MISKFVILSLLLSTEISAVALRRLQPPGQGITCPTSGGYTGESAYVNQGPKAAPLRGTIGCVDDPVDDDKLLIYGPFEAGFSNAQLKQFFSCSSDTAAVPGGVDTNLAEKMMEYDCDLDASVVEVLDDCGGHAVPYHYHEKMTCLYSQDVTTGHSTRAGTALDGKGIYGKYIDGGVQPTDLDAYGGRTGVTPDSNGAEVYYYVIQDIAPFTIGCFGPVASVQECRDLYTTCGDGDELLITTADGTISYDPDCPCYDSNNSNIIGDGISASNSGSHLEVLVLISAVFVNTYF